MGGFFSSVRNCSLFTSKPVTVVMVGLDAAGKTTILYRLLLGTTVTAIPTTGFNVETVHCKNVSFVVWDVAGGCPVARTLWRHYYYESTKAVIFVVDASDLNRLREAEDALIHHVLSADELREVPLLILANKQDVPGAVRTEDMVKVLGLDSRMNERKWFIQACTATTGEGLLDGMDWLAQAVTGH